MAELLSTVVATIALFHTTTNLYKATRQLASRQQHELLARNYGAFSASLVTWLSPQTAQHYESIHHHILRGSKEEAVGFREAITNECNMTAVAVSITSQTSLRSLIHTKSGPDTGAREPLSLKSQSQHLVCHF